MGGSQSEPEGPPLALPTQQIVDQTYGGGGAAVPISVGSSTQTKRVTRQIALHRGGARLQSGVVVLEVSAKIAGVVELFVPALEHRQASSANTAGGHSGDVQWPSVQCDVGEPTRRVVAPGDRCIVRFDGPGEPIVDASHGRTEKPRLVGDGVCHWPVVVVLRPRADDASAGAGGPPPDGSMMACCDIHQGQLRIVKELVALGGDGSAHLIQELFGISEMVSQDDAAPLPEGDTAAAEEAERNANCVICLTSPKDTALMPCGHFCVCYDCGAALRLAPGRNRCPLCRKDVHNIVHIEVASAQPVAPDGPPVGAPSGEDASAPEPAIARSDEVVSALQQARAGWQAQGAEAEAAETAPSKRTADEAVGPASLPPRCLQRLTREMRLIEEQRERNLSEHGVELALADPQEEDLRVWHMRLHTRAIDADCELGRQLRSLGVPVIEAEVWIPDLFPMEPPRLRVLSPSFGTGSFFVQPHGAVCMEILTKQGWTPATSLPQLGVHVKTMMSQGKGSVSAGSMGGGLFGGAANRQAAWRTADQIEAVHSDWQSHPGI